MLKRFNVVDQKMTEVTTDPCLVSLYVNPDEAEKRYLIDTLKIDEHTLNSALDPDELSRLEFEPEHMAIIFKRPKSYSYKDQFVFRSASTGLFLFKDRLIIVISEDVPVFDGTHLMRSNTPAYVMLRTIYRSIFHFLEHLRVISSISDQLQDKINRAMENRYLINLFTLEKSLVYYLNSINSNSGLLEKIRLNAPKFGFTIEESELLEDTLIENSQCYRQSEMYSNILASLMDARASIVSNNINVLVKTLNIITICIMVPTLVVSAFSMNVSIPFQKHPYAFWIILSFATVSVLTVVYIWWRRKW
ncbi:MAG: magnesium transporter CorA family protein [Candidatus Eisenbacteria bacterium]